MSDADVTIDGLPTHYATRRPQAEDAPAVAALLADHQRAAKGSAGVDPEAVLGQLVGTGSWTRRQVLVHDPGGHLLAWFSVHDRAAGRTLVEVTVSPSLPDDEAAEIAGHLYAAGERHARDIATMRGLRTSLLDTGAYADDPRQQRWLDAAGYRQTRTWLQMTRPVAPSEATSLPGPREGVVVRPVDRHDDGLPVATDLQAVHRVLEESFQDHFSSYRESFPEFVMRLREDPGHRWDHWWLADGRDRRGARAGRCRRLHGAPAGRGRHPRELRRLHRGAPACSGTRRREGVAAHRDRRRRSSGS